MPATSSFSHCSVTWPSVIIPQKMCLFAYIPSVCICWTSLSSFKLNTVFEETIPNSLPCSGLNKSLAPPSLTAGTAHGIHSCSRIRHAEVKLFVYMSGSYSKLWASRARPPERPMKMQIPEPDSSFPESELLGTESEKLHFQIEFTERSLSPLQSEAGSLESKAFTYHSQWHTRLLSSTWSLPWLFMSSQ